MSFWFAESTFVLSDTTNASFLRDLVANVVNLTLSSVSVTMVSAGFQVVFASSQSSQSSIRWANNSGAVSPS